MARHMIGPGPGKPAGRNREAQIMMHITGTALRVVAFSVLVVTGLALLAGKDDIRKFHRMHSM
jgi:hypothetical protein